MGAVPKKKPSKTRQRKQHSQWSHDQGKLVFPSVVDCKQCGASKVPHRVCAECGYYKGTQVIEPKTQVRRVSSS